MAGGRGRGQGHATAAPPLPIQLFSRQNIAGVMLSAGVRGAGDALLGLAHLYPPPAAPRPQLLPHAAAAAPMTPEFLPPPPRPYARYPPRAPRPAPDPPSAAPAFPPVPGAYARFLPHPPYQQLYRAPQQQQQQQQQGFLPAAAAAGRLRTGSGFVPPAPRPPSPAAAAAAPQAPESPPPCAGADSSHFCRGALIRLESGLLRRVEDMRTEDFVSSAERCADLALTHCTLLRLEERGALLSLTLAYDATTAYREQVEMESTVEHPFFVYGQGWASCAPERTLARYGLAVRRLRVGDVCVSLVARRRPAPAPPPPASPASPASPPQSQPENLSVREEARKRRWSAPDPHPPPFKKR